jgi:ferric-dicitrate binding protein FerR (iron transport regulator)
MSLQEAKQFVAHFIAGGYTPEEYAAFLLWLKGATADELNAIADEHESLHESWSLSTEGPSPEWIAQLEEKLDRVKDPVLPVRRIGTDRFAKRRLWFAAASILILVAAGVLVYRQAGIKPGMVQNEKETLATLNNTFVNPRGGDERELVLADGSKVWLNAGSSLKYPSSFSGTERLVQLSGEAFFEVAKNPGKPFRVLIREAEVDVLGTEFNVMAYDDEPVSRTTLVEGAVKITSSSQNAVLKPGEQAEISYTTGSLGRSGGIRVTNGVNTDKILAWRKGLLEFENADLRSVMREIGRRYNVGIQYGPNIPDKSITGNFSRKDSLDKILDQLEATLSDFHFRTTTDGKTVTVSL